MGAMNAYVAAAVKLAGALAADGAAPRRLADPRRALMLFAIVAGALLAALAADAFSVDGLIRATSTSFVAVYVTATAAGTRLLTGRARAASATAFVAVLVVFAFSGVYLVVPLAVAVVALSVRRRTPTTAAPHAAMPPAASTAAS
jgi:amino acid efflux transporter